MGVGDAAAEVLGGQVETLDLPLARVWFGDAVGVAAQFEDESVDFVCTDPPYGLGIGYGRQQLGHRFIVGDHSTDLLLWACAEGARLLRPDRWIAVFCDYRQVGDVQTTMATSGLVVQTVIVWDKGAPTLGGAIRNQYELIVLGRKGDPVTSYNGGNLWRIVPTGGRPVHPHEKPLPLMHRLVEAFSQPGDLVVDFFAGSGSTLRACRDTNRQGWGIEVDPQWRKAIEAKLAQETLWTV